MSIFQLKDIGQNRLTAAQIMRDPILFLAFGFGSGLAKKAPGTCGTVAALPVYLLLEQLNSAWWYGFLTLLLTLLGIWLCDVAAKRLGEHDFGGIVWDEIAGFLITMSYVPATGQNILAGFVLFRLFDIVKPWPIKWIDQKVAGGFGIMLDDVIAGIFACLCLLWLTQWMV